MRATRRGSVLTLAGLLVVPCLVGTGCQYQMQVAWSIGKGAAGTSPGAGSAETWEAARQAPRTPRDEAAAPEAAGRAGQGSTQDSVAGAQDGGGCATAQRGPPRAPTPEAAPGGRPDAPVIWHRMGPE